MLFVQWTSLGPLLGVALAASDINTARAPWYTVSAVDQHRRAGLSKTGHAHRGRPTGARPSAAAARATVDRDTYVGVPEYWKCLNTLSGAFYFYDAASQKKYLHGLMEDSPVRPSTDPCETLQKTDVGYKVFNVRPTPLLLWCFVLTSLPGHSAATSWRYDLCREERSQDESLDIHRLRSLLVGHSVHGRRIPRVFGGDDQGRE